MPKPMTKQEAYTKLDHIYTGDYKLAEALKIAKSCIWAQMQLEDALLNQMLEASYEIVMPDGEKETGYYDRKHRFWPYQTIKDAMDVNTIITLEVEE